MAEIKKLGHNQNNYGWGTTWAANSRVPIIDKRRFETLAEAQAFVDDISATATATEGLIISVINDTGNTKNNGVYYVQKVANTDEKYGPLSDKGTLVKVGSTETEPADNYSAAVELSKSLVVGQLIKVASAETIGDATYQAGFYIVEGSGVISSLSTSTGANDEIGALKTRVTSLETNKADLTGLTALQTVVSGKVDEITFVGHTSNAELHVTAFDQAKWNNAASASTKNTTDIANLTLVVGDKADASALTEYLKVDQAYNDAEVRGLISAETTARVNAITSLTETVNTKVSINDFNTLTGTVETNYNTLNGLITAETTARTEAISSLTTIVNTKASNDDLTAHTTNGVIHVTSDDKEKWNSAASKVDVILSGTGVDEVIDTFIDFNNWLTEHGNQTQAMTTAITANLESITSLTQTVDTISGKVENNITAITKNTEDIATKAAKSDLDALADIVGNEGENNGIIGKLNALAGDVYTKDEADGKFLTGITVDAELSSTSPNPIQNKAVHAEFIKVRDEITSAVTGDVSAVLTNYLKKDQINTLNNIALYADTAVTIQMVAGLGAEVATDAAAKTITISPKISAAANNALSVDENGLYVQAITIEGDDAETVSAN